MLFSTPPPEPEGEMYTKMNTRPTEGEFYTASIKDVYFNPIYTEDDEYSELSLPHLKDTHYPSDIEDEPGKQV